MTNFVTCCKFVNRNFAKKDVAVSSVDAEQFSRTLGNLYAQTWAQPEIVCVDSKSRPELKSFMRKIASSISTAKIVFEKEVVENAPKPEEKAPEIVQPTEEVTYASKTTKNLQSVMVVSKPGSKSDWEPPDKTIKLEENGSVKTSQDSSVTNNVASPAEATAEPCHENQKEGPKSSDSNPVAGTSAAVATKEVINIKTEIKEEFENFEKSISNEDTMLAGCNGEKVKHKHKKHKDKKKKHKHKSHHKEEDSERSSKRPKSSSITLPDLEFDPLDPAQAKATFVLRSGIDEGEILSDNENYLEQKVNPGDFFGFTETSPEQFASIVSSMNKFYSTCVPPSDEFVDDKALEEANSDDEDLKMKEYDNLIISGKVESEGDVCGLDIYVYNREEEELFVHHDLFLPAFPIVVEWLDYSSQTPSNKGNFVAVGTVKSEIEIWPVDEIGSIQPIHKLGAPKGLLRNSRVAETLRGHSGAVTCLSWNRIIRKGLASGGVDCSVAFWDLEKSDCLAVFNTHEAPVSSVAFHPVEPYLLLSAGFDKKVSLLDLSCQETVCEWTLNDRVEQVLWSSLSVNQLFAAQTNGHIACIDLRFPSNVFYEFKAHSKAVTGLAEDKFFPGCLVSIGEDSHLKLWNVTDYFPVCVKDKNMKMGVLTSVDSCPSNAFVYCVGGQASGVRVVDLSGKAFSQFSENTDGET